MKSKGTVKKVMSFLLASVMLVSMAACGNDTKSSGKAASTIAADAKTSEQPTSAAAPAKREIVKVMSWWDITSSTALQQLKTKFEEKNNDLELEFTQIGKGYATKVLTIIAGGGNEVPDIMMLAADKLPMFASTDAVVALDKYITEDYKKGVYPMVLNACSFKGKQYAVARDVTSMVMYFNTKMFAEAKVEIPGENWTTEQFLDLAKKMTVNGADGKTKQWGYYFAKSEDTMYDWLLLNGGDYAAADGSKSLMGTAETKTGLQFLQDLIYKHKVCPTDIQAKQFGDKDSSPIVAGKVAMTIGGLSFSEAFKNAQPAVEYAIRPLPVNGDKKVTHSFVNTWTIPRGAKKPDVSWRALEFFSGKDGQQIALNNNMGLPASKDVDTALFLSSHPDKKYLTQSLEYAVPFRTLVYGADFYKLVSTELELVWLNQKTVEAATKNIEAKAADILAGKQ